MTPDLMRIEAALNAYPWTPGTLTTGARDPRYCAVGILLRYAGVAREHLGCAVLWNSRRLWEMYGALLLQEYGIPNEHTMIAIMAANDSARSHGEAIDRVRRPFATMPDDPNGTCAYLPPSGVTWFDGGASEQPALLMPVG
jgi:hypothetical protein